MYVCSTTVTEEFRNGMVFKIVLLYSGDVSNRYY